jgi:DNA-binding MurR/RpiR family transcriptional regulator
VARTATKPQPARKSLSDFITERFDDFSRSQKDVARYIVDHLDEAAFQTAEELARRANTSSSTVVRFSQALGFDGYPELQQAAIEEYRRTATAAAAPRRSSTSTTRSSKPRLGPTIRTSRRLRGT